MIEIKEELQETNALISNILTASPVGVITYDETGRCTYANKSAAEITGATREQLLKQNYHAIESWKKSGLYDMALKAVKTGKTKEKEVHITSTFGKEIWISCRYVPFLVKESGQLLLLIEDVSERRKAENALKEAYEQAKTKVREQTLELKRKNQGLLKEIRSRKEAEGTIKKQADELEVRIKETECINKVLELKNKPDYSLEEVLTESVGIIPSGWQYPEITCARITFNGKAYVSSGFRESRWNQEAEIKIPGMERSLLEVYYKLKKPDLDEGPFLNDERKLIDTLAGLLGNYIRKRHIDEELELKNQEYYSLYEEYEAQNEELRTINEELSEEVIKRRKNEEALQESESKFRETVKYLDEGYYSVTTGGLLLDHNRAFNRILGIDPDKDMKGAKLPDFWQNPDDRKKYLDELMTRGFISNYQINAKKINGENIVVIANSHLVRDEQGELLRIEGTFQDFTDRIQNEEALKRSENELRIRNRLAEVFLTIHDERMYDEALKIVLKAMKSKFGVFGFIDEKGDFIVPTMTRQVWDTCKVPEKDIRFPREIWVNSDSAWPTAMREQRPVYANKPSLKIPEGHVSISKHLSVPIVNKGRSIGLLQVANKKSDYTGGDVQLLNTIAQTIAPILEERLRNERQVKIQKEAEKALRESEKKYRTLLENIPQKIFMKDKNYRWVSINENLARDMKIKPEEVVGKVDSDFYPKELADKYRADDQRLMKEGKTEDIEEKYLVDGQEFWVHTVKTPVRDDEDKISGILGIFWDITEQKSNQMERERLTAELLEKNKELEQIVFVTSHDLRSPLVNIQGFSWELDDAVKELGDILKKKDMTVQSGERISIIISEEIPEALRYINTSITKMDELLKGLLALSRVGRVTLEMEKIDMKKLLKEITDNLDYKIKEKEIQLTIGDLPDCKGDKTQLNQAFTNLIENAMKFMDPGRKRILNVTGWKADEKNIYCIEDNGIGIEKEHQENIFQLFHKLTASSDGEGLGLAIVRKIIERHNGEVWVESETGKGSKFYISF